MSGVKQLSESIDIYVENLSIYDKFIEKLTLSFGNFP